MKGGFFLLELRKKGGNVRFYRENDFFNVSLLLLGAKKAAVTFIIAQLVQNWFFLEKFHFFTKVNCVKTCGSCFFCRNMHHFEGQTQLSQRLSLFLCFWVCAGGRKLIFDLRRSPFYPLGEEAGGKRG